jgi:hypothetical protein
MDRSPRYRMMCEQARDIQASWRPAYGDFFVHRDGRIDCWIPATCSGRNLRRGFEIQTEGSLIRLIKHVWLPRQDQLIEMAQTPGQRFDSTTQAFYRWTKTPYQRLPGYPNQIFTSMEQIWLAFVMEVKFHCKWTGTRWAAI